MKYKLKDGKALTELQEAVLLSLIKPDIDVPINDVFDAAYGDRKLYKIRKPSVRQMQQKLAPTIKWINSKLEHGRVEPGELKQTYRFNTKG